jgi:hypothetical protein
VPGDQTFVAQQAGSRVVLGEPARDRLELVLADHPRARAFHLRDDAPQFLAGDVLGDRRPIALDLVGCHHVVTTGDREPICGKVHVAALVQRRADRRLVRGLVRAEPHVAVGPEDLALAELLRQLREQCLHRSAHGSLVHGLVRGPIILRVICLQVLVEFQGLR